MVKKILLIVKIKDPWNLFFLTIQKIHSSSVK